ncbi:hypothetical protein M3J09_004678 [Ascochyta lentis]
MYPLLCPMFLIWHLQIKFGTKIRVITVSWLPTHVRVRQLRSEGNGLQKNKDNQDVKSGQHCSTNIAKRSNKEETIRVDSSGS